MDLVLHKEAFLFALMHSSCSRFSSDNFFNMVYELLQNYFVPNDFASGFDFCFEICRHIVGCHVPPSISRMFVAT
jgi:hypothetical protein